MSRKWEVESLISFFISHVFIGYHLLAIRITYFFFSLHGKNVKTLPAQLEPLLNISTPLRSVLSHQHLACSFINFFSHGFRQSLKTFIATCTSKLNILIIPLSGTSGYVATLTPCGRRGTDPNLISKISPWAPLGHPTSIMCQRVFQIWPLSCSDSPRAMYGVTWALYAGTSLHIDTCQNICVICAIQNIFDE